jgi:3-methyladenine DNA glycosylase/8-oxoguanine DNA glycosylase
MSRLRYNRHHAVRTLKSRCPQMAELIRQKGAFSLRVKPGTDLFTSLASAIAYQQLSGKAAATI